jgi:hypothetical protein
MNDCHNFYAPVVFDVPPLGTVSKPVKLLQWVKRTPKSRINVNMIAACGWYSASAIKASAPIPQNRNVLKLVVMPEVLAIYPTCPFTFLTDGGRVAGKLLGSRLFAVPLMTLVPVPSAPPPVELFVDAGLLLPGGETPTAAPANAPWKFVYQLVKKLLTFGERTTSNPRRIKIIPATVHCAGFIRQWPPSTHSS